jgi:hypothetical protein
MARIAKDVETSRLTLELANSVRKRLENLRNRTEADSLAEVIRRALAVYEVLWDEKQKGNRLMILGTNGDRELVLI